MFTGCPFRVGGGGGEQRRRAVEQVGAGLGGHPAERLGQRVDGQHLTVATQQLLALAGEPDERAAPVGGIALALEQALAGQPVDDLADHRLRPPEVHGGLADGQRARDREVGEHRAGRARQVAARAVAPVVGQVERAEEGGEPLRPRLRVRPVLRHGTTLPTRQYIVNPDGSTGHHALGWPATPRSNTTALASAPPVSWTLRR